MQTTEQTTEKTLTESVHQAAARADDYLMGVQLNMPGFGDEEELEAMWRQARQAVKNLRHYTAQRNIENP